MLMKVLAGKPIKVDLYKSNKICFITLLEYEKYVACSIITYVYVCGKLPTEVWICS